MEIVHAKSELEEAACLTGKRIAEDYPDATADNPLILISVLKGAFYFTSDISRHIDLPTIVDFLAISRFPVSPSDKTRRVQITNDLSVSVSGKHVLVIEDIVDTGLTMSFILRTLRERKPKTLEICTLFDRRYIRIADIDIKYSCFEADERFLIGYGLDLDGRWRNLPCVASIKPPPSMGEDSRIIDWSMPWNMENV